MFRNKTACQHNFATVPRADIPRSKFHMRQTRKQAFNASELIPIMVEEVLPGDTWSHKESILARLATPIAPLMDDLDLETFYFFVPNRILWKKWEDFITGKDTAVTIPQLQPLNIGVTYEILSNSGGCRNAPACDSTCNDCWTSSGSLKAPGQQSPERAKGGGHPPPPPPQTGKSCHQDLLYRDPRRSFTTNPASRIDSRRQLTDITEEILL